MECIVCCNTLKGRKTITCTCGYIACRPCVEQYLLQSADDAHCMKCRHQWSYEFLADSFTRTFVLGLYKLHRENILFERAKIRLPLSIPQARKIVQNRRALEHLKKINTEQRGLDVTLSMLDFDLERMADNEFSCEKYLHELAQDLLPRLVSTLAQEAINDQNRALARKTTVEIKETPAAFIRACPANGCRGFLSSQWRCQLCHIWVCKDCHEIKGDSRGAPHTCAPEHLATAELLRNDSKPCPSCASMIFRIEGCSQMFCTVCHKAFDWRTGKISTGIIHNPHYFEYQRTRGLAVDAEIQLIGCDEIEVRALYDLLGQRAVYLPDQPRGAREILANAVNYYNHNHAMVLPRYDPPAEDLDLHVNYLVGDINDDEFKKLLQQQEKKINKLTDYHGIIQTYLQAQRDMLMRLLRDGSGLPRWGTKVTLLIEETSKEIVVLRSHFNDWLERTGKRYACVAPYIGPNYNIYQSLNEFKKTMANIEARKARSGDE